MKIGAITRGKNDQKIQYLPNSNNFVSLRATRPSAVSCSSISLLRRAASLSTGSADTHPPMNTKNAGTCVHVRDKVRWKSFLCADTADARRSAMGSILHRLLEIRRSLSLRHLYSEAIETTDKKTRTRS